MTNNQRAGWAVLAAFLVVLGGGAARADPLAKPADSDARKHLSQGNRLYAVRSFEDAVVEYKAGAVIEAAPVFDYNLGQCYRQLGKAKEAIWHYERFVSRGRPEGELRDAVNGFLAELRDVRDPPDVAPAPPPPPPVPIVAAPARTVVPAAPWYRDRVGLTLTVAGVLGAVAAGALILDARGLDDDANHNPDQRNSQRQHDKASSRRLAGAVVGAVAVGLVVSGRF